MTNPAVPVELGFLGTYSAEGVAETDLEVELIPAADFQKRAADDPAFRVKLFDAVARRFADLERLIEDVALSSIAERLSMLEHNAQAPRGALERYRFLLEEYQVSLFAQTLKTSEPVSPKRLERAWADVTGAEDGTASRVARR